MNIQYFLTAIAFSVVTIVPSTLGQVIKTPECQQYSMEAETCVFQMLLLNQETFPRNDDDIVKYCDAGNSTLKCITRYRDCLKGLPRQVFSLVRTNVKGVLVDICSSDDKRKEVLHHAKCLNDETMPEVYRMVQVYANFIEFIANNSTLEQMIPRVCCIFHYGKDLMYKKVGSFCDTVSGPETKDYVTGIVSRISSDVIELGCGGYPDLETCRTKESTFFEYLDETTNSTTSVAEVEQQIKSANRTKGFLLEPLLKIADDLTL